MTVEEIDGDDNCDIYMTSGENPTTQAVATEVDGERRLTVVDAATEVVAEHHKHTMNTITTY